VFARLGDGASMLSVRFANLPATGTVSVNHVAVGILDSRDFKVAFGLAGEIQRANAPGLPLVNGMSLDRFLPKNG